MEQFRQILVSNNDDLYAWLASLVVGACGVGVILWGASISALWLGRKLRTATGVVGARRPAATIDKDNPIFVRNLGQCVASSLQAILIGPNSQIREVLDEFKNSLQFSVDTVHEAQAQTMQDMQRKMAEGHNKLMDRVGLLVDQTKLANPAKLLEGLEKVQRECRSLHEAFSEFKTVRANLSEYKQALKPEFEEVHGMIAELKKATAMTDQEVEAHFTTLDTNVKKLQAALSSFEAKVVSAFADVQTRDNGFNGKFANYHDGQLAFQDGLKKSIAAIGTQTTTPQIQEIVQGCLQNDEVALDEHTSGAPGGPGRHLFEPQASSCRCDVAATQEGNWA